MPTINQLPPTERKEFARSMAKELYSALDGYFETADEFGKRAYRQLAESGLLHEENFYGERLNEAQLELLKTFHSKYHEAWSYGEAYDKHIAPLEKVIPGFAFSSELLRRAWCMKLFLNELNRDTCPFGSMLVFEAVDDRDRTDESNDENDGDESEGGRECGGDSPSEAVGDGGSEAGEPDRDAHKSLSWVDPSDSKKTLTIWKYLIWVIAGFAGAFPRACHG